MTRTGQLSSSGARQRWRHIIAALTALLVVIAPGIAAHAATSSITVSAASVEADQTVTIDFTADQSVSQRNWVGIYHHGDTPGGPVSVDWQYVDTADGGLTWGPQARDGWTSNESDVPAGDYDVYLFSGTGYTIAAGPVQLTVTGSETPTVDPVDPKPEVDGASELSVLTFNIWHGGSQIPDGIDAVAEVVRQSDADVVFLPEKNDATSKVAALLGYPYVWDESTDTGIVSRYPITETGTVGSWWNKAIIDVNGVPAAVYGGHLEYQYYANYLPRGYGGAVLGDQWPEGWDTWGKLAAPYTDVPTILAANEASGRPQAAQDLLADADSEAAAGRLVMVGGDFNEASWLDWTDATKDMFDHNGTVIPWQTTKLLADGGLVDAYRSLYPDPVTHPGITWPSDNPLKDPSELAWAADADERDRIDYVFFRPDERVRLDEAQIVGPKSSILRSQRVADETEDPILTPTGDWPSDHKAVLATFSVCAAGCDSGADDPTPNPDDPGTDDGNNSGDGAGESAGGADGSTSASAAAADSNSSGALARTGSTVPFAAIAVAAIALAVGIALLLWRARRARRD